MTNRFAMTGRCLISAAMLSLLALATLARGEGPANADLVELCAKIQPAYVFIAGGSGVVIRPDGLMLTNSHVVGRDKEFDVRLGDGSYFRAKLLGRDPSGDLAALRLQLQAEQQVPHLELGDSESLKIGERAIAVGNPFGLGIVDQAPTFTLGVVSALHQRQGQYTECIVTDAEVNPGNSGGPLVDMAGKVVGINGQISTRWGLRSNTGLGYAISARQIKLWLPQLEAAEGQDVPHGRLPGIEFESAPGDDPQSVVVKSVEPGTAAAESGFQVGDAIVRWDGEAIPNAFRLVSVVGMYPVLEVPVDVRRGDSEVSLQVRLAALRAGQLGLTLARPAADATHVRIEKIEPESAAAEAGLLVGDEIVAVEGTPLNLPAPVQFRLLNAWMREGITAGDAVTLTVRRKVEGEEAPREIEAKLTPR